MNCLIYRCSKKQEMYLYLPYQEDESELFANLSDELKAITGQLDKVMELELTPERKLARANVHAVIEALNKQGFYLQMPPNALLRKDESMLFNPSDSF